MGFRRCQPGTNLRAWLFRILHNRWISSYRMKQRHPDACCVGKITDRDLASSASHSTRSRRSAEDEALDDLPDREITEALRSLPEGFQKVLYYAGVEGFTYAETADPWARSRPGYRAAASGCARNWPSIKRFGVWRKRCLTREQPRPKWRPMPGTDVSSC